MSPSSGHQQSGLSLSELLASYGLGEDAERIVRAIEGHVNRLVDQRLSSTAFARTDERLWTPTDVQTYLGVSPRTLAYLIEDGEIVPLWIGGQRRFHPDTIRAFARASSSTRVAR